jgi:potassium efflux system protein
VYNNSTGLKGTASRHLDIKLPSDELRPGEIELVKQFQQKERMMRSLMERKGFSPVVAPAVLVIGILLVSMVDAAAAEKVSTETSLQTKNKQTTDVEEKLSGQEPELADIIPMASELSSRLAVLETAIKNEPDVSKIEKEYDGIEENLNGLTITLQEVEYATEYKYRKLVDLRTAIKREDELFKKTSEPFDKSIRQLVTFRKEWLAEKQIWSKWQASMLSEGELEQLKSTFKEANDTINTAMNLILEQLRTMLKVQAKGGAIRIKIDTLAANVDQLIVITRHTAFFETSPPMFSSQYFSQFSGYLWLSVRRGAEEISWPDRMFFAQNWWIVLIDGVFTLSVIITIYRNLRILNESKRWCFLAARPFSAGLFLACMTTSLILGYEGAPEIWKLAVATITGISFARLSAVLIEESWKRQFVYGLVSVFLINKLLYVLSFPLPLLRLYMVLMALTALLFCLHWTKQSARNGDSGFYKWPLRLGSLFLAAIMIAELRGKAVRGIYLFESLINSLALLLVLILFMYMIRGVTEWLFRQSPLRRATVLYKDDTEIIIRRLTQFINAILLGLILLPAILTIWQVYGSLDGAIKGLLAFGFNLGSQRITVGLIIACVCVIYGSVLVSWILQKLLMDEVLLNSQLKKGSRHSVAQLVHYLIIFVGFLVAISMLGVELTKVTIILSALGIGIGFGLQSIVNNFICGLILLFEQPVRVGDTIEIGGKWAEIRRIGLRSTTIKTFDEADVIVPNSDLITNQVTNWTLTNRLVRLSVPVGVAYGSDVALVIETLMACAKANSRVAQNPLPQVLFLSFGESSLDFELRVWILDADYRLEVTSELHQEVDSRFRKAKIEIAFPQRDLRLRSLDESVILRTSKTK